MFGLKENINNDKYIVIIKEPKEDCKILQEYLLKFGIEGIIKSNGIYKWFNDEKYWIIDLNKNKLYFGSDKIIKEMKDKNEIVEILTLNELLSGKKDYLFTLNQFGMFSIKK